MITRSVATLCSVSLCSGFLYGAQDAGSLMKSMEQQLPKKEYKQTITPLTDTKSEFQKSEDNVKIFVKGFELSGNSLVTTQELQETLKKFIGKQLSFDELQNTARVIADLYHQKGYQARAYLPPQDVTNGVIQIVILEGKLSGLLIDSTSKNITNEMIRKNIETASPMGKTLLMDKLDRGILLLNDIPGIKATGRLQAGEKAGETVLRLNVEDTEKFQGFVNLNNHGARSTGHNQAMIAMNVNSPTGKGDQLSFQALGSYGVKYGRAGYMIPVGYNGLKVGANASLMNYDIIHMNATGEASTLGINTSYPMIRSRNTNIMFNTSYDRKKYENRVNGDQTSSKIAYIGTAGFEGITYDTRGSWNASANLTLGYLDLSPDYNNFLTDFFSARTNGHYTKISSSLTRNQDITSSTIFSLGIRGQMTNKNLDTSEKIYLGGPTGVRAYPLNEAGGDSGYIATASLRYSPIAHWSFTPFYDMGVIHQHRQLWNGWEGTSTTPNVYGISGKGINVDYFRDTWSVNASLAWKTGTNPNAQANGSDNDGTHDVRRVYVQLRKGF